MPDPAPGAPSTTATKPDPPFLEVDIRPTVESAWGPPPFDDAGIRRYYLNLPKDYDDAR